jgi:hypothetical protein
MLLLANAALNLPDRMNVDQGATMIRFAALAASTLLLAQPAFACRVGWTSLTFEEVPPGAPADHAIVLAHFSNTSKAYRDAAARLPLSRGVEGLIGVATFSDSKTLPVYALVSSCALDYGLPLDKPVILVGKFEGEKDERVFRAAGHHTNDFGVTGRWYGVDNFP